MKSDYPLVVLITSYDGEKETIHRYNNEGLLEYNHEYKDWQLMIKTEKKIGWVYLYKSDFGKGKVFTSFKIFESKEEAEQKGELFSNYVGVAKIKLEE